MELSESVKIIEQLDRFYTSFNPDEETVKAWASELMAFEEHDAKWVWMTIKAALVAEGGNFVPSLPWILNELGCKVNAKVFLALPKPDETREERLDREKAERISEEQAAENMAKIQELVAKAIPEKRGPSEAYRRATTQSSDDLELDTLTILKEGER